MESIVLFFLLAGVSFLFAQENSAPSRSERPAFLFLPNGWGNTPEAARRDLDRVMAVNADRPGFHRFTYCRIVHIARNSYQADGMCTWDAPPADHPVDPRRK